jgi:ATP synthase F1 gamma subunit
MDTFSTYNKKLAGYRDVSETVKILEKVAAGQLHTLERQTTWLAKYTKHILSLLGRVQELSDNQALVTDKTNAKKSLLVIITGDKGLVGDLWHRLFSYHKEIVEQDILVIGKKGQLEWPATNAKITHYSFADRLPNNDEIYQLGTLLDSYMETGAYKSVSTLHVYSESLIEQIPTLAPLLPIVPPSAESVSDHARAGYPIIEGSIKGIQKMLYKKYLLSRIQQIVLETAVAEYSSRTVAMEHASAKTDAETLNLTMVYSRERRQRETQKQLERFAANKIIV